MPKPTMRLVQGACIHKLTNQHWLNEVSINHKCRIGKLTIITTLIGITAPAVRTKLAGTRPKTAIALILRPSYTSLSIVGLESEPIGTIYVVFQECSCATPIGCV
jgi:hypothetical protein